MSIKINTANSEHETLEDAEAEDVENGTLNDTDREFFNNIETTVNKYIKQYPELPNHEYNIRGVSFYNPEDWGSLTHYLVPKNLLSNNHIIDIWKPDLHDPSQGYNKLLYEGILNHLHSLYYISKLNDKHPEYNRFLHVFFRSSDNTPTYLSSEGYDYAFKHILNNFNKYGKYRINYDNTNLEQRLLDYLRQISPIGADYLEEHPEIMQKQVHKLRVSNLNHYNYLIRKGGKNPQDFYP